MKETSTIRQERRLAILHISDHNIARTSLNKYHWKYNQIIQKTIMGIVFHFTLLAPANAFRWLKRGVYFNKIYYIYFVGWIDRFGRVVLMLCSNWFKRELERDNVKQQQK